MATDAFAKSEAQESSLSEVKRMRCIFAWLKTCHSHVVCEPTRFPTKTCRLTLNLVNPVCRDETRISF